MRKSVNSICLTETVDLRTAVGRFYLSYLIMSDIYKHKPLSFVEFKDNNCSDKKLYNRIKKKDDKITLLYPTVWLESSRK